MLLRIYNLRLHLLAPYYNVKYHGCDNKFFVASILEKKIFFPPFQIKDAAVAAAVRPEGAGRLHYVPLWAGQVHHGLQQPAAAIPQEDDHQDRVEVPQPSAVRQYVVDISYLDNTVFGLVDHGDNTVL